MNNKLIPFISEDYMLTHTNKHIFTDHPLRQLLTSLELFAS